MSKKIIYPGTFDPITNGHVDLVGRALHLFDGVVIAVAASTKKDTLFTIDERIDIAREVFSQNSKVEVCAFSGLLIDFAREKKIMAVLRGLRAVSDFEYELQLASLNRRMEPEIDTIFLTPAEQYAYVSSSMIREISSLGGDVSQFVPRVVQEKMMFRVV